VEAYFLCKREPPVSSYLTKIKNQSSSNFGFSAENPAAVSPIDLIDHPVEVVAKSVVLPIRNRIRDQHSCLLEKSVILGITSRGGRPHRRICSRSHKVIPICLLGYKYGSLNKMHFSNAVRRREGSDSISRRRP
jgi:hypothetical protein